MSKKDKNEFKIKGTLTELDRVSLALEKLTGLTLNDIVRQVCAQSPIDYAQIEYKNLLKMQEYLSADRISVQ